MTHTPRFSPGLWAVLGLVVACAPAARQEAADVTPAADGSPPNVVLVVVDALRADHLGAYGYPQGTTPRIDAIAAAGLLFENAYSNATFTFPSTASLFTSTLPVVHRITHNPRQDEAQLRRMRRLSEDYLLLPEVFKKAGYTTALLTFPGWVSPTANYLQGVDVHVESERNDEDLLARARNFVDQHAPGPFFVYLHFIDLHDYFDPRHLFAGTDPGRSGLSPPLEALRAQAPRQAYKQLAHELGRPGLLGPRDLDFIVGVYDRRLRATDEVIGQLVSHLEERGLGQDTVLALTSDHGEQFLEHGRLVHGGDAFYNEVLRIPFVVTYPRSVPAGRRATTPISSIDFAPTLLDLAGLPIPDLFQGESLVERLEEDRTVFATDGRTWKALSHAWSFIRSPKSGREELYDLRVDPGETRNLVTEAPEIRDTMRRQIATAVRASREHPYLGIRVEEVEMPDQQVEALRSLGYLD